MLFGPHETNLGHRREFPARHVAYYARRAADGAGVVVTETASVHPDDWPYERAPLAADCGPGWAATVAACRPHDTPVLAGVGHTGGQGSSAWSQAALWAPSRVPDVATREMPMEMEDGELAAVVDGFAAAARPAVAAGTDGVGVDAGPRALLRQFSSGLTNLRSDGYGADRLRLTRTGRTEEVPCAVLVDCGHRLPADTPPPAGAPRVVAAGDVVAPRIVLEAVLEGRRAALALHRGAEVDRCPVPA